MLGYKPDCLNSLIVSSNEKPQGPSITVEGAPIDYGEYLVWGTVEGTTD